jgi:alcohol dehydrogenase YqhD (iron-dependent ADH family)
MNNFTLYTPTKIYFGKNEETKIGSILKGLYKNVLIHYGSNRIVNSGLLATITNSLDQSGINYTTLGGVVPNPRLTKVYEGIKICKENKIDHIIAIGGGSVLDSAKAIALGAKIKGDVWKYYYIDRRPCKKALSVSAILTIPAAGSENSNSSVITNEETKQKIGYQHDLIRCSFSIINPEFFETIPHHDFSAGVFDMMSHIFERYFSNTPNNDVIDGMSESILRSIMRNALIVESDIHNYAGWSELALASTFAHNGMLGVGRVTDWASHQIEHELSAMFDITHGVGLAIITPAWMKYVYSVNKDIFYSFSTKIMEVNPLNKTIDEVILEGIKKLESFITSIHLPLKLKDVGITKDSLKELSLRATNEYYHKTPRTLGGLKLLNSDDIYKILLSCLN